MNFADVDIKAIREQLAELEKTLEALRGHL